MLENVKKMEKSTLCHKECSGQYRIESQVMGSSIEGVSFVPWKNYLLCDLEISLLVFKR